MFEFAKKCLWIFLALTVTPAFADRSTLWNITNDKCVPDMREHQDPRPCTVVDLTTGFVVLKDHKGATQYLVIPTARTTGIEEPALLAPDAPNYWDRAWRARALTEKQAGKPLPREALSLSVNSAYGRTQDQLHIHIDCLRPDVRDALAAHRDDITLSWASFPVRMVGEPWRAMRVDGENLGTVNPFKLLATGDPDAAADMGKHTLLVAGMTWSDGVAGFAIIDGKADLLAGNRGSSEELQDHDCAIAR